MNSRSRNLLLIASLVVGASVLGGVVAHGLSGGEKEQPRTAESRRPIIQIIRQQPDLPSIADRITNLCPSVAAIMPVDGNEPAAAGFAISSDGWVLASTAALPSGAAEVHFGSGPAFPVTEIRSDHVSGVSIVKTAATGLATLPFADQTFPRVGDFGFALIDPAGSGCSATAVMISSDFLTDGGAPTAYIRVDSMGSDLPAGAPLMSGAGQAFGVAASAGPSGAVLPADLLSDITDELLRNSLSPTTRFGFRAEDFDTGLSSRLSDSRSSGTVVALVQPKTSAARAGLQAGDVIVAVDGSPVASASELGRALDGEGKSASLDIARADQRLTLSIARLPGS